MIEHIELTGAAPFVDPASYPDLSGTDQVYMFFRAKGSDGVPPTHEELTAAARAMELAAPVGAAASDGKITVMEVLKVAAPHVDHGRWVGVINALDEALADNRVTWFEALSIGLRIAALLK